ncbi:MAG: oligosaccharide flippase family protein, partial [Syntrophothermus sp.]
MDLKEKAIKSVKWTTISTVVGSAIQVVQLLILSRLLEPKDFGLIAVINVIIVFVRSFADLGVAAAIIHHQDTTERQLSTLYWLNLITGICLFLIVLLFRPFMVFFFKEPILKDLLLYVSISLLIAPVGSLFQVLFQKELRFNLLAGQEIISTAIGSAVTIASAFLKQGAWSLVWGQLANISARTFLVTSA